MHKFRLSYTALLRAIEKHMRTDIRYIIRGGFWLFIGQLTGIVSALLLAIVYARYLPKETYGNYKYVISILGILSMFTFPGMETAAQKGLAQGHDGAFWSALKYRMSGGLIAMIAAVGIGTYYYFLGNMIFAGLFFASAPFLIGMDPLAHYSALLTGKKRFRAATVFMVILQLCTAGIILATVIMSGNIFTLIMAYVIGNTICRGALLLLASRLYPTNNIPDDDAIRLGKHMSVTTALGYLTSRLDAILLFHFLGPIALATYSFAQAAANNIQSSFKLITGTLAFPKFAGQDKEVLKKTLLRKVYIAHIITVPLALGAIFFIPFLYHWLFPKYLESIPYAQVMTGLLAFSPLRFISTAITAKASLKTYYTLAGSNPIVSSICLLICVPLWGIWGAIIALAIQQSISNMLGLYLFKRM
jgi:O-antigen/teichoic acid export membrane protein